MAVARRHRRRTARRAAVAADGEFSEEEDDDDDNKTNELFIVQQPNSQGQFAITDAAREAAMDESLARLGVSFYQALMAVFVAMVYAADGAEVTVMSLVARTLGEKWQLESWKRGLLGTSVYTGMFAGGLLCGPVADSRGRSFTLITATALISIFGILSAYAPTFNTLCAARFVAGVGMGASLPVSSSLLQETVPKKWKGGLACLVFAGFNLGELFAAKAGVFAFGRPDPSTWLFLVAALPAVATFLVSLLVPESPRFLAARGNVAAVSKWFKRAARVNRKKLRRDVFTPDLDDAAAVAAEKNDVDDAAAVEAQVARLCSPQARRREIMLEAGARRPRGVLATIGDKVGGLFKRGLRLKTLVLWTLWMAANASFYGMIFSLPECLRVSAERAGLASTFDVAKGISRVSALQALSFLFFMPLVFLGVQYALLFPFAFAGASLALFAAVANAVATGAAPSPFWLINCLAVAKFFYNGIFMLLYPATGEAYPTQVRATGVALAGTVGRICTILVPPVCTKLQELSALLPYQVFVFVSGLAFLASLLL